MANLDIQNLSIAAKGTPVVTGASITLKAGEVNFLLGPNGSGKSSLLGGIFGHPKYEIISGIIRLDGEDITVLSTEEKAKRGLFLSLQHVPEIRGVTLWNFLHRSARALTGESMPVLEFKKLLSERLGGLGLPYHLLDRELNVGLSGGEKKLVELMQLIVLRPKLAVLDEIDSGVDVDSLKLVAQCIGMLAKEGTGFLLVTHHSGILQTIAPSHVYVMKKGSIVEEGGPELARDISLKGFN